MKEIKLSELKQLKTEALKSSPCLKVTSDGEVIFYAIVQPEGLMKDRIEGFASMIDAGRGR